VVVVLQVAPQLEELVVKLVDQAVVDLVVIHPREVRAVLVQLAKGMRVDLAQQGALHLVVVAVLELSEDFLMAVQDQQAQLQAHQLPMQGEEAVLIVALEELAVVVMDQLHLELMEEQIQEAVVEAQEHKFFQELQQQGGQVLLFFQCLQQVIQEQPQGRPQ
jgi:hypothetical protein